MVESLISRQTVNMLDSNNLSLLFHAVKHVGNEVSVIRDIINAGANVEIVDDNNCTIMHVAVIRGHNELVKMLVKIIFINRKEVPQIKLKAINALYNFPIFFPNPSRFIFVLKH
jgi:ankyrin repeat protein